MAETDRYDRTASRIEGPLIPVLAAFTDDEALDIDATCRWVDWLIGCGMTLFWTTHGTTSFDCLTDGEITDLTRALAATIDHRGTYIAGTAYRWSTRECIRFVELAAQWGADVVKLQVNWAWNPSQDHVLDHYATVAAASPLPLFAYTLAVPGVTRGIGAELLRRIIDIPQFIGLKNDTDDFYAQAEFLRVARGTRGTEHFLPVTGGSMSSFLFGYDFGARAFGTTVGWFAPHAPIDFYRQLRAGHRSEAVTIVTDWQEPTWQQWKPLGANMHWAWAHAALTHMGWFSSPRMRFPLRTLTDGECAAVRAFLEQRGIL